MRMTKAELEQKLRDKEAVIARLENDLRILRKCLRESHEKFKERTNDAIVRGQVLKFLMEKYFTAGYPKEQR